MPRTQKSSGRRTARSSTARPRRCRSADGALSFAPQGSRAQIHRPARRYRAGVLRLGQHISAEELYAEVKKINPARRLRDHLPHAAAAQGMRAGFRAPLRRRPGALRGRRRAASRPFHLRAMRQDHRVRKRGPRAACSRPSPGSSGRMLTRHKMELYGICADCLARDGG